MSEPSLLAALPARRRSLLLRVHFWAALIASPFILVATLTGLVYIFTPQVEARLYAHLDRVTPAGAMLPLDRSVAAARMAAPGNLELRSVAPAFGPGDAVRVSFEPARAHAAGAHHHAAPAPQGATPLTVFVNPYDARVLGAQAPGERFSEWARTLHSRLLQGEGWRWMIELAASWLFVMLLTGLVLWWPGRGQPILPRRGKKGRAAWRQWHAFGGVALGILSLVMVATGITWSRYAGEQVRALRDAAGQASPQAPRHLHSAPPAGAAGAVLLGWQQAWMRARELAPPIAMQLTPPQGAHGVWRATGIDRTRPTLRFDLMLDAYTGQTLYRSGWEQQTAFGKATALGIPFHRGEFGIWNQVVLFLFGAGVLFSLASGWVMFFKRRGSSRAGRAPLLPPLLPGAWRAASPLALAGTAALCLLMPLLALSGGVLLAVEWVASMDTRRSAA
ncbi:PepSY-associated TM helix domain-containing protein [Massilia niabensis]|uniref:PepSY-associated TM helix domain-containing protein n=2 Tax=Massilia niabensis TaxID=544910 RepID=A0ABW0KZD6_9BURK